MLFYITLLLLNVETEIWYNIYKELKETIIILGLKTFKLNLNRRIKSTNKNSLQINSTIGKFLLFVILLSCTRATTFAFKGGLPP